jgi:hypothetical protein
LFPKKSLDARHRSHCVRCRPLQGGSVAVSGGIVGHTIVNGPGFRRQRYHRTPSLTAIKRVSDDFPEASRQFHGDSLELRSRSSDGLPDQRQNGGVAFSFSASTLRRLKKRRPGPPRRAGMANVTPTVADDAGASNPVHRYREAFRCPLPQLASGILLPNV